MMMMIFLFLRLPAFRGLMTNSGGKTYESVLNREYSLYNWLVYCSEGVQPCFGERELVGRANLHFRPAATVQMQI